MEYLGFVEQLNTIESALEIMSLSQHPQATIIIDPFHNFRGGGSFASISKLRGDQIAFTLIGRIGDQANMRQDFRGKVNGDRIEGTVRIEGGGTSVRGLGDIGVNITRQGTLEFNEGKLKASLIARPSAVADFLAGSTGFSGKARSVIAQFSNPLSGALSKRTFELSDEVAKIEKEKAAADLKVEAFRERLVRQFATMQSIQSQMGGLTNFLKASDSAANKGG
jgi:hypothetical protein